MTSVEGERAELAGPGADGSTAIAALAVTPASARLVERVLGLAARAVVGPEPVRRSVAARLDAGSTTAAAEVLGDLEAAQPPRLDLGQVAAAAAALEAAGARVLVVGEPGYPGRLAAAWPELGAPLWLFTRTPVDRGGRLPEGPAVAVVGTRRPTLDGLRTARELGGLLADHGVVVVSGMARGIDQAAHRGALEAGGATVAVLGAGFARDYPAGSARLREEVCAAGGLVSELLPDVAPRPAHFLWRNRIIAGLADVTVVVEGRARSGALQTARLAAAQGREVLAVPGSLHAPASRAPLDLIRDGAQPLTRLDDVLDVLGIMPDRGGAAPTPHGATTAAARAHLDPVARAVLDVLGPVPATPGALAAATGHPVAAVVATIAELTARGLAATTPRGVVALST